MKTRNCNGITLLEVMISILVLSMGILGLAPLVGVAIYNNTFSNDVAVANAMAQKEIESLLQMTDYGALPFYNNSKSVGGVYNLERMVNDNTTDASVPNGVYRVSVNIAWIDQVNLPRLVNYTALKPKL